VASSSSRAKLVAKLLEAAGAHAVLALDLHADQLQGFFDIRSDFLYASGPLMTYFVQKHGKENVTVVAPDVGSSKRARAYAKMIGTDIAIIDKRRLRPNQSEVMNLVGEVKDKTALIVDDEINTGGTIVNAAKELVRQGAKEVFAMASHGVFAAEALEKLEASPLKEVIVTNSIPQTKKISKLKVISVAPLLGEAIRRMHEKESISKILHD